MKQTIPIDEKYENEFITTFTDYFDSESEAREHFRKYLNTEKLFLLFVENKLAGFFNYYFQYSHYANYLEDIAVNEKFRGKGLSKDLLRKYIEISKGQKTKNKIALSSTHTTNNVSQKMHLSFGCLFAEKIVPEAYEYFIYFSTTFVCASRLDQILHRILIRT